MSFFRTVDPAEPVLFEGEASLGAIYNAGRDVAVYADNYNARERAREEAFDSARTLVRKETGIELGNPQRLKPASVPSPASAFDPLIDKALGRADPFQEWDERVQQIIEQHPDKAEALGAARLERVDKAAHGLAVDADERLSVLQSTRPGLAGFSAGLAGGFRGALEDPLTIATLPIGLGAGGARTVGGKILSTAWREALVSGATEAAMQPVIQKWRAEAGLSAGLEEGLKNIGMATALGGILGGGIRGAIETPGAVRRQMSRRPDPRLHAPETDKIAEDLLSVREELPPATRAAVDVFDQDRAVMRSIRAELGDDLGAEFGNIKQWADNFAERLDAGSGGEDFTAFLRDRELAQDPDLANRFRAARETMEEAQAALDAVEAPLNARTLADTLEKIDPDSAARMRAIDEELDGPVPAKRKADLEAERARIVETIGEDVLSRTEREFRIGPEKQAKRARRKAREARKAFNAIRRTVDGKAKARLEANRAGQDFAPARGGQATGRAAPDAGAAPDPAPVARAAGSDPFEPGSKEFGDQLAALEDQIDPDDELADLLYVDDAGAVTASGRTVGEALEDADRGHFLSQLVEACKLS